MLPYSSLVPCKRGLAVLVLQSLRVEAAMGSDIRCRVFKAFVHVPMLYLLYALHAASE